MQLEAQQRRNLQNAKAAAASTGERTSSSLPLRVAHRYSIILCPSERGRPLPLPLSSTLTSGTTSALVTSTIEELFCSVLFMLKFAQRE